MKRPSKMHDPEGYRESIELENFLWMAAGVVLVGAAVLSALNWLLSFLF